MTTPASRVPTSLSGQLVALIARGVPADYVIGGIPFRVKPTQEDPILWDLRSSEKEQFDSSQQAGENSFGDFWLRSQATFHGGAGQKYLDSSLDNPEISRARFESSVAAFPHEAGELTIAGQLTSSAIGRGLCEQVTWATVPKLVTASTSTNQVYASTLPALTSTTTVTLGASGVPTAMTSDGTNVYVAIADKIYRVDSAGAATHTHNLTFTGTVCMGFAKQRLIVTVGNKVYELDPNPSVPPVAVGAAHYTNPSTDYVYTSVSEGPNGIYLSGYSGTQSDVSSMSVTESAGTLVLGPPVVQLRLPPREIVNDVFFYIGSLFALATSNGARVGSFTPYGQPQMGRLIIEDTPCTALTGDGNLIYVGAQDSVWWIDLATPTDQVGGYSYACAATGVGASSTDPFTDIEVYTGGLIFGTTAAGRLVAQPTYAPDEATLTTSWSRFGTTEPKRLHYVAVEGDFPVIGGIDNVCTVVVENAEGETVTFNVAGGADNFEFSCQDLAASQAFRLHFTLRDTGTGNGVLLRSWQMKATPAPTRFPDVTLPLMCFNREAQEGKEPVGYDGYAKDRLLALLELARRSEQVTVQDKLLGINYQAEIRRAQFRQDVGLGRNTQFGGTLNVILKQV
jgi:hypothetical protein